MTSARDAVLRSIGMEIRKHSLISAPYFRGLTLAKARSNYMHIVQLSQELARIRGIFIAKGWTKTTVTFNFKLDENTQPAFNYAYFYPKVEDGTGGDFRPSDESFYIGSGFATDEESRKSYIERIEAFRSVNDERNSQLFAAIDKVKLMAEDMQLSADFINPITALAEQLRTNILAAPAYRHALADETPL
jgi:hypothetical protein